MLEEIRSLLELNYKRFVYQMDLPNSKYYDYIKNGRKLRGIEKTPQSGVIKFSLKIINNNFSSIFVKNCLDLEVIFFYS